MEAFQERLSSVMREKKISQCELCTRTGIPKSALSQYISGRFKPKQERTALIAEILNVNPAWLMGYDVPRDDTADTNSGNIANEYNHTAELNDDEYNLIMKYRENSSIRLGIDALLNGGAKRVFRAAKSPDGKISPCREEFSGKRLERIREAPETDEDL